MGYFPSGKADHEASVYRSAAYTLPDTTGFHIMVFDTETYDVSAAFDTSTGRYTAPAAGLYDFESRIGISLPASGERFIITCYVDGSEVYRGTDHTVSTSTTTPELTISGHLSVTTGQIVDIRFRQVGGTARSITAGSTQTRFHIARISG